MHIVFTYLTVLIMAFLAVFSLTPIVIKFAYKIDFLDNPAARKVHKKSTPLLGGLAVFSGFFLIILYIIFTTSHPFDKNVIGYITGAMLIVIVGLIDDKYGMSPLIKMSGQVLSCLIFLYFNGLFTLFGSPLISIPILTLWMVGLMNALNFLDNMDGIISGMSAILALGFYALSFMSNSPQSQFISLISLTFAGAVLGFLPYNFNPAKIFLGDAGSMFIGYFLASLGILLGRMAVFHQGNNKLYFLLPVLMLSYAIFDISLVSITRKRDGRKISQGGKDHSTHRIGNAMGSAKITALIIYLINIIITITTILIYKMSSDILLIISTGFFALIFLFFGRKLDQVPVVIPQNQLKTKEKS